MARPGDVNIPGVRPVGLVDGKVDLVLEKSRGELAGGRALRDEDGPQVMSAILVVGRHIGGTIHRLSSVEADEAIEQPPAPIEGLGRVTRRPAGSVRRGGHAGGRDVVRVAGHEAVLPAGTAVGRPVIPGPYVAVDDRGAVVV